LETVREYERSRVLLDEERRKHRKLISENDTVDREIKDIELKLLDFLGTSTGSEGLGSIMKEVGDAIELSLELKKQRIEELRLKLENESSSILSVILDDPDKGIRIHPDKMRIGRYQLRNGQERVVPVDRLSAGERESVLISLILALAEITNSSLILDSPFSNMDMNSLERSLRAISTRGKGHMVMIPTGKLGPSFIMEKSRKKGEEPDFRSYKLVHGRRGSVLREVSD
jgi:hypothetical protein